MNRRVFVERLIKVGTNTSIFHLLKNNPTACFIYFLISQSDKTGCRDVFA